MVNSVTIKDQILTINPSVPPALFRLLMRDDSTAYLREDDTIIGFEVVPTSELIEGFALIGMRKRTILAYRSEDASPRLVVFPSMDKLFNPSFGLLGLTVKKIRFTNDSFHGTTLDEGLMADLISDLTPPEKQVTLPDHLTEQMIRVMVSEYSDQEENDDVAAHATLEQFKPVEGETIEPVEVVLDNPYFEPVVQAPKTPEEDIESREFESEHAAVDYILLTYGVDKTLLMKLLNALLLKTQGMPQSERTRQYQLLVCKLIRENPSVVNRLAHKNTGQ